MTKPLIAVTTSTRSGWRIYPLMALNIWLAGGRSVRWGTGRTADLDAVDGLIIGGGDDIGSDLYGGVPHLSARIDPERDALERQLAADALDRGIPVLGICRGAQMMNIALGGTLEQDAFARFPGSDYIKTILPRRRIRIAPDTHLARHVGTEPLDVNSLHTQAVDTLGRGLRVAARDAGGMIQAIERVRDPFALGVQWHPEHIFFRKRHRAIFGVLVTAARAYADARNQTRSVARSA